MDKLVYTALSGLRSQMSAQSTIANNIANASTTGYRAERVNFDRLILQGQTFQSRELASFELRGGFGQGVHCIGCPVVRLIGSGSKSTRGMSCGSSDA